MFFLFRIAKTWMFSRHAISVYIVNSRNTRLGDIDGNDDGYGRRGNRKASKLFPKDGLTSIAKLEDFIHHGGINFPCLLACYTKSKD